ncbi:hypothetical protein niasHS_014456 [Heterodera schachtii]|uniref:Uncharacterized protein n=1 Tax=Heterodera schachtii TaxID=97005 RepID=A0ABD2IBB7_HETSC
MSDLSDDYSHVGDYELRQELIKWDKLRNRRANKSLKMPPTDIGTSSKLPANGKDNGYGAPPENAQLKRNIETKMGTTDSEEKKTEPKEENKVPSNEKRNGYYRLLSENAKKNAQLKREIKEILGIIDSDEKETEPKGKKFCEMFSWVQLFFCLAFLLLSFAVFCYYCASNKTQTSNTPIHSNSSSVPSNVPEPPFLVVWYPVLNAIVFYIVTCSVIVVYIAVFSLLVYMFCMSRRFSAIAKREEAEKMNDLYAKIEAEIDEEELEMAEFDANLRWDET